MIVAIGRWRVRAMVPVAVVMVLAVGSHIASAQPPVVNAKVETRSAAQGLAREVQAITDRGTATWLGYRVPIARRGNARFDSSGNCCGRCRLEPPTELVVLARFEARALTELRAMSIDCDVDGGGMPLVWLDSVDPDQSVSWLGSLVTDDGRRGARI